MTSTADTWALVPSLTTTEAVCLLALDHLEAGARRAAAVDHVAVGEVAAVTGLTTSTAGAALRTLANRGRVMRPVLRRRRPELDPTPTTPDRTHLHLEALQAVADRYACDHPPCIAKRDQAAAAMAGYLAECGVDLDDPVQLHAALAGLAGAARIALAAPIGGGVMLAQHVAALSGRTPVLVGEGDR